MKIFVNDAFHDDGVWTAANGVTVFRTVICMVVFSFAISRKDETLNYLGLGLFWLFDILDGFLARRLNQETILGAQFDIVSDRISFAFFYMNYMLHHPGLAVVVIPFLFNFLVLDQYLSTQFLRWPLISPNYFYRVDRLIWRLNWSAPGKFCNSGLVTFLLIGTRNAALSGVFVALLLLVKFYSIGRLLRISTRSLQRIEPDPGKNGNGGAQRTIAFFKR